MIQHNYSIDTLIERIYSYKTSEYFKEVTLTFYASAYRSCIVTLYSVVICDIIFKLEELRDVYNDESANKILKEISDKQIENLKSPDWETNLIDFVKERTSLLELYEIEGIYQLQKLRHLSAHPVLTQASILYTPNRETITAHIKNMLVFVLTKPPFFSKKLATDIIIDIAKQKDKLINLIDLKRYLDAKYFKGANQNLYNSLFRKLWKFIFKLTDVDCNANRKINFQSLEIIYDKNRNEIENLIRSEQGLFNFINEREIVKLFISFLFDYPNIYSCLNEATQILTDAEINENQEFKFLSWFKFEDFEVYYEMIKELVRNGYTPSISLFVKVLDLATQFGKRNDYLGLSVRILDRSGSFHAADSNFSSFIEPFLAELTEIQLTLIINHIQSNNQLNSRKRAAYDNEKVKQALLLLNSDFDFEQYSNF